MSTETVCYGNSACFRNFAQYLYNITPDAQKGYVGEADANGRLIRLANSPDGLKNISFKKIFGDRAHAPYQPTSFKDLPEATKKEISKLVGEDLGHLRAQANAALNESQYALDNLQSQGSLESQITLTSRKLTVLRSARGDDVTNEMDDVAADQAFRRQEIQRLSKRVDFCKAVLNHPHLNSEELPPAKAWYERGFHVSIKHILGFLASAVAVSVAKSYFGY